jgi:hypothetical protein
MPVSITAKHNRLQLTSLKLLSWTVEQGELLQFKVLNLKHLYLQGMIWGLCWLHIGGGGAMLGVLLDGCMGKWQPAFVLLTAYPVQNFFHIDAAERVQEDGADR